MLLSNLHTIHCVIVTLSHLCPQSQPARTTALEHAHTRHSQCPGQCSTRTHTTHKVGSLSDHYNFELTHGSLLPVSESQRSRRGHNATAHAALSAGLDAHPAVLWSAHQHARSRRRRTLPYANVAADVPPNAGDTRARRSEQFSISDPDFPRQWHLRNTKNAGFDINVFEAWKAGYSGRGVVVTIVDDGK